MAFSQTLVYAALVALVAADFAADATAVASVASGLSGSIAAWDTAQGAQGAVSIQLGFPAMVSAVGALSADAGSLTADNLDVGAVKTVSSAVVNLLNILTKRVGDFQAFSVAPIVVGDINSLQGPAVDILASIVKAVGTNSNLLSLTGDFSAYTSAFDAADDAYGINKASWPALPSGVGGGSSPTSSAPGGGSGAGSSAPAGSSAAPSAAASATGAKTSAAASAPAAKSSAAASAPAAASSAPKIANGAAGMAIGAGAAALGAAALLI